VTLIVDEGSYEVTGYRFPLLALLLVVVRHRTWHAIQGHGWVD